MFALTSASKAPNECRLVVNVTVCTLLSQPLLSFVTALSTVAGTSAILQVRCRELLSLPPKSTECRRSRCTCTHYTHTGGMTGLSWPVGRSARSIARHLLGTKTNCQVKNCHGQTDGLKSGFLRRRSGKEAPEHRHQCVCGGGVICPCPFFLYFWIR